MHAPQGSPPSTPPPPILTPEQAQAVQRQAEQAIERQQQLLQQLASQGGDPSEVYQGHVAARRELENQLDRLKEERYSIAQRLRQGQGPGQPTGVDAKGLEARLVQIDARITALDKQIAEADANVAKAAAVPGAVVEPRRPPQSGPPDEVYFLTGMFMVVVLLPVALAYARRIWRKSAAMLMMKPQELIDRFTRLEQSLDSIAVEVERVGEGQRFLTRMHAQQERALGAGPAERVEVGEREAVRRK